MFCAVNLRRGLCSSDRVRFRKNPAASSRSRSGRGAGRSGIGAAGAGLAHRGTSGAGEGGGGGQRFQLRGDSRAVVSAGEFTGDGGTFRGSERRYPCVGRCGQAFVLAPASDRVRSPRPTLRAGAGEFLLSERQRAAGLYLGRRAGRARSGPARGVDRARAPGFVGPPAGWRSLSQ